MVEISPACSTRCSGIAWKIQTVPWNFGGLCVVLFWGWLFHWRWAVIVTYRNICIIFIRLFRVIFVAILMWWYQSWSTFGHCSFPKTHAWILAAVELFSTLKKKIRFLSKPQIILYGRIKGNQTNYLFSYRAVKAVLIQILMSISNVSLYQHNYKWLELSIQTPYPELETSLHCYALFHLKKCRCVLCHYQLPP